MNCPTDGSVLVMSERSGVEIDYCPTCRGVWLDRGELDKILERAERETGRVAPAAPAAPAAPTAPAAPPYGAQPAYGQPGYGRPDGGYADPRYPAPQSYDPRYGQQGNDQGYHRKKKKEHWLSDLFD
ncbi:zf-TFIIB domain-containing protein [Microbacterium sp. HD4P20]|uniref:TFIIB-type zinc ribbon-containing protein n=1 Tax=Microbacterium sp. HD4P20 TaxID=2864874 RepID=UPI001C642651|nr:zf-TFIIB domain-containing protein [Microbacterium sp. HD4P20]MCP2635379.1 zf-TFIIB domain-containing protein [Microbacterium sp. HD4P20]